MASPEGEIVAARLARMKALVLELEKACAEHKGEQVKFLKLKAELDAARAALKLVLPPGSLSS